MKWEDVDWINVAQGRNTMRAVVTVMKLLSAMNVGTFWTSWPTGGSSIRNMIHGVR
jgi:hypothetical protein